jgi:predicted acetyltransferase
LEVCKLKFRNYNFNIDKKYVHRIWQEIGWIDKDKRKNKALDIFLENNHAIVAELNEEVEGLAISTPGSIRYLNEELKLNAITGITISRIARKKGLGGKLTASIIADNALNGALVSALSMFEQGFYNKLGFGTGCYENFISFDPSQLNIDLKPRVPVRISLDDWEEVHKSRLNRLRNHGSCNLYSPAITRAEMMWSNNGFGLGYCNKNSELSHYIWFNTRDVEHGPYEIAWMVYQNWEQFTELMALVKSLGDQIHLIKMIEPTEIQMQDLIKTPFKNIKISEKSKYKCGIESMAFWQMRILDLKAVISRTHLQTKELHFNLQLNDPIEKYLSTDSKWKGVSGQYIISLGPNSRAERAYDKKLPTMVSSIGAFTRLWLGVRSAVGLAVTDDISAPDSLLNELGHILRLPPFSIDWYF